MPVYGVDRDLVPESERLANTALRLELDSLRCEITSVGREACCVKRWQVELDSLGCEITSAWLGYLRGGTQ